MTTRTPLSAVQNPQRRRVLRAVAAASLAGCYPLARAQGSDYPNKPIRLIVGFGTGSGNDQMARDLAPFMSSTLGQPVVVENRAGAGGSIGTDLVAKAAPDGYTIGLGTSSQLVMNVGLYKNLPFDVERDLRGIGLISNTPLVLVGSKSMPATLKELIALARSRPGKISYGSAGAGSITHIVGAAFAKAADIELLHVPFKGNAAALVDLTGGHIDLLFDSFQSTSPLAAQGRLRLLGVSSPKRLAVDRAVPTFVEQGLTAYEAFTWNSLFAPARTPPATIDKLNAALNKALKEDAIQDRMARAAALPLGPGTPQRADAYAQEQRDRWVPFVRSLKLDVS